MLQASSRCFLATPIVAALMVLAAASAGCNHNSTAGPPSSGTATDGVADRESADALSVQTVMPHREDLVAKFEQPCAIEAVAQTDLYSRATGYIKTIDLDIGDTVQDGQVLLEVDLPDISDELAYKEALVRQAEAEHTQAETAVQGAAASLVAHAAEVEQAESEVNRAEAEQKFRKGQDERYARLAEGQATTPELAEEKHGQFEAAVAAYASSVAKRKAVLAEKAVLVAKLDAAKAELQTRATRADVAKADRQRARSMLDFASVRAPFDGVITHRNFDEGAFVSSAASGRGEPIFTIARIDRLLAVLRVPEKEVSAVQIGCRATLRLGGQALAGRVARFSPSLDEKSRTMRVEIEIDNRSRAAYPGMYGPGTLILKEISQALTVPASAVYAHDGRAFVIQVRDGTAHPIAVETGYDDGRVVQVLSGLQGSEEIVVSNKGQIAEGQRLQAHRIDGPQSPAVAKPSQQE